MVISKYQPAPFAVPTRGKPMGRITYTAETFRPALSRDFERAKFRILIQSPYLTVRAVSRSAEMIAQATKRGVQVCVFVEKPADWDNRLSGNLPAERQAALKAIQAAVEELEALGTHVTIRPDSHPKIVAIDNCVLWTGSLNFLSHYNTSEHLDWDDTPGLATQVIVDQKLDRCLPCFLNGLCPNFSAELAAAQSQELVHQLRIMRHAANISQSELAAMLGLRQKDISEYEHRKRLMRLETMVHIGGVLGHELVWVPTILVPTVDNLIRTRMKHLASTKYLQNNRPQTMSPNAGCAVSIASV